MTALIRELARSGSEAGGVLDAGFHVANDLSCRVEVVVESIDDHLKVFDLLLQMVNLLLRPLQSSSRLCGEFHFVILPEILFDPLGRQLQTPSMTMYESLQSALQFVNSKSF